MNIKSINPATEEVLKEFDYMTEADIKEMLSCVAEARRPWSILPIDQRSSLLVESGELLRSRVDDFAHLISSEMGKPIVEARAEVEKCAWVCDYYAEHGAEQLANTTYESDASKSYVSYPPLGTVLAIMPWNFPFWQLFRCAAPALMAGNSVILKHSKNVPQCAMAIEALLTDAGFPEHVFRTALITGAQAGALLDDERINAVSFTGSTSAGSTVAAIAGANIKKSLLELGGSDAFIVLDDANLGAAVAAGLKSRYQNAGQSCIAAKRFIVCDAVADEFVERFAEAAKALEVGDPLNENTQLGPMARGDLRQDLHDQVVESIRLGAAPILGCEQTDGHGYYYPASVLDRVSPGMPAYTQELFGPVASVIRVSDAETAIDIANDSPFGLGSSIWSSDVARAEHLSRRIAAGSTFINGVVKSDPRLPFGGVKQSGYGRELADVGIKEFVNIKTVWIA